MANTTKSKGRNMTEQPTRKVGDAHATGKKATTHVEDGNNQGPYKGKLSLGKAASMEGPKSEMPAEAKRYENAEYKFPEEDKAGSGGTDTTWDRKRDLAFEKESKGSGG